MLELAETFEFSSAEWGPARIDAADLGLLSDFTGVAPSDALDRLAEYEPGEMARAWHDARPSSSAEIRTFYAETDLYLWELFGWNGSRMWATYDERLQRLARLWAPARHRRALDYGCGIGTAALRLAELGYAVTLADVPGRTLAFARERLARHGHRVDVIEVTDDLPDLGVGSFDVLVSFDVLEHVPNAAAAAQRLARALTRGGGAAVVASFDVGVDDARWPHHLAEGRRQLGGHRWEMYWRSLGMAHLGDCIYRRGTIASESAKRLRYEVWQKTGLYVARVPR